MNNNDIDNIKLEKIEKNCYEIARKQLKEMQENNDKVIAEGVEAKLDEYKNSLAVKFEDESKRLKRDFNREVYEFEMSTKARINSFKKQMKDNMFNRVEASITAFVDSDEYKGYLLSNIRASFEKHSLDSNKVTIFITEKDFGKFGEEIKETFKSNVETIPNENIGGSIVIDRNKKISVDNTIRTNIIDKIDGIKI
jgi:vacuolar-type H+-ATPase subunit E/Vma4